MGHHKDAFLKLAQSMLIFHKYHYEGHRPLEASRHEVVVNIFPENVSDEDHKRLLSLGWDVASYDESPYGYIWSVT